MQYNPHDYQKYVIEYIEKHPVSAVFLDMGLGKTSITLTAINNLLFDYFAVHKVLVIAPLRVAKNTWSAEINKWDHLNDLKYSIVVGTPAERKNALKMAADIYIINRENIPWLAEYMGTAFDFDMVVIDELSSFKNYQAKRFKALMKVRPSVKRIVGLTGTPSSNGLMDLFAEFKLLDTKGTWAGKPFELIDWQEQIIRDIFGTLKPNGYRQFNTAYIEIPKKMGKSELAAAVALLLTCGDGEERAEVYGCAADRQQASIVFEVAADMVRMCPALSKRVKIPTATKRIIYTPTNSFYQVLSAEAYSKHGFNIHGVVFDELHTQPNRKLFDVMTRGSGDARM